jgi:hypothetical protein
MNDARVISVLVVVETSSRMVVQDLVCESLSTSIGEIDG